MTPGQLGLVLLYAAQLQRAGMDYMMSLTSLEQQFVSVERVAEYTRLRPEPDVVRGSLASADGSAEGADPLRAALGGDATKGVAGLVAAAEAPPRSPADAIPAEPWFGSASGMAPGIGPSTAPG